MKRFTISIPDSKADFFMELMKNISFIKNIHEESAPDIPEEHKSVVRERVEKYKNSPDKYMTLDELEKKLNKDE